MSSSYVRRCDTCCRYRKGPARPQGAMQNGVGLAPFQKFHIDLTGPSSEKFGWSCIFVDRHLLLYQVLDRCSAER